MTRIGIALRGSSPADDLHGLEAWIFGVGAVTCAVLFVVALIALIAGIAALVEHVRVGRKAIQEEKALRARNEEHLERLREWREENYKLRDQVARLERERADERGDYRGETLVASPSSDEPQPRPLEQET